MKNKTVASFAGLAVLFFLIGYGIAIIERNDTELTEDLAEEIVNEDDDSETEDEVTEVSNGVNQNLAAWMPRLNDVYFNYPSYGPGFFFSIPQFNMENYYQVKKVSDGVITVEIYEYSDNEIVRVFSRPETGFRDNFTENGTIDKYKEYEVVLKKPIAVGTSWSTDKADYKITAINKQIEVASRTFKTIEVTIADDNWFIKRYYAENVGLVRETSDAYLSEYEVYLAFIHMDVPDGNSLSVYQPDDQATGLYPPLGIFHSHINEPARIGLQELLTGETEDFEHINLLPKGTKINKLFLNNDEIVEIDLSSEYITNRTVNAAEESLYLSGLGNTFSEYYGVEKVLLTIDGENYQGPHITLADDEYLTFDQSVVNEPSF